MSAPPLIPEFLAHRPTRSGLVVPYISLELGGRIYFGQTRGARVAECLVNRLCQICGRSLEQRPYLFLMTQHMIDDAFSGEPPLHPVCARYTLQACPMVGGRMATYATHQADLNGAPCDTPGCGCAGVISGPSRAGEPAEPWLLAWYGSYAIGVRSATTPVTIGAVTGAALPKYPIKIRPIAQISEKEPWPTSPDA